MSMQHHWQPEHAEQLAAAIARIERELPGWWWSTGSCSISAHASVGPDLAGVDKDLLDVKVFDDGFHGSLAPITRRLRYGRGSLP